MIAGVDAADLHPEQEVVGSEVVKTNPEVADELKPVIGVPAEAAIAGRARFEREGVAVDAVLLASGDGGSLLRFADATNGEGTYPVGRYLHVEPPGDGGMVVLDFNRAYNPPCAFTPYATCSIAPASNELPFPVTAGERWAGGE